MKIIFLMTLIRKDTFLFALLPLIDMHLIVPLNHGL